MKITQPIYTADIGGSPLRFFAAPGSRIALPWHALADLLAAMNLSLDARTTILRAIRGGPFADAAITLATPLGPVVISPHSAAQGLIGAFTEAGAAPATFDEAYHNAAALALAALLAHLPPSLRLDRALAMATAP